MRAIMNHVVTSIILFVAAVCGSDVGIVWFGRNDVPATAYSLLLDTLAGHAGNNVTVASARDDPVTAVRELREHHGVTRIVVLSHGMERESGIAAQSFVADRATDLGIDTLVLLAGFLQRKYRPGLKACAGLASIQPERTSDHPLGYLEDGVHDCSQEPPGVLFPVPVLSVGGELDGVVRVGRLAEATHIQRRNPRLPVVVIEGMTHSMLLDGFVTPGDVPGHVTTTDPRVAMATVAGAFETFMAGGDLSELQDKTEVLTKPLITAFIDEEGSWWLNEHADEEHGSSGWAAKAQQKMASPLPQGWSWSPGELASTNAFHLLTDESKIPPYFRNKHRADVEIASVVDRTLVSSTVAQLRYVEIPLAKTDFGFNGYEIIKDEKCHVLEEGGFLDFNDDGKAYVSAIEISTKLASRQIVFNKTTEAVGGPPAPDSLDAGNRCADINRDAYRWALNAASTEARRRHEQYGVPLTFTPDESKFAGPWWIYNYLNFTLVSSTSSNTTLDVGSWFAFASTSAPKYGAGNHYCKLLSPARALEWIYTDSLKAITR